MDSLRGNVGPKLSKELDDVLGLGTPGQSPQLQAVLLLAFDHDVIAVHAAVSHIQAQQVDEMVLLGHRARAREYLRTNTLRVKVTRRSEPLTQRPRN